MAKSFEFWFDVGSPASYLAWTQLGSIEAATGAKVALKPMLLGGVFQATGNHSPVTIPAKGAYTFHDFARFARRYGVPLNRNPYFPINTLMLMRGAVAFQMRHPDRLDDYLRCVFEAIWVEAQNMNQPEIVGTALQSAGFNAQEFMALIADPAVKDRLKALTQEAVERGIFGAPSFFVGPTLFWGQDRIDFVKEALLESP